MSPPTKPKNVFAIVALGCSGLAVLAFVILFVGAYAFRGPSASSYNITYEEFMKATADGKLKASDDGVIRVRFVTAEGRYPKPPHIQGFYFRSEQDRASQTLSIFATELPTEAQQAAFRSFAASRTIQVEDVKERNLLPF
jgi:hypothetical protein